MLTRSRRHRTPPRATHIDYGSVFFTLASKLPFVSFLSLTRLDSASDKYSIASAVTPYCQHHRQQRHDERSSDFHKLPELLLEVRRKIRTYAPNTSTLRAYYADVNISSSAQTQEVSL
jgi:hypothetical protein